MPKDPIEELTKAVRDATSLQSIEHLSEAEIDELRQLIAHEERGDAADFAQSRMVSDDGEPLSPAIGIYQELDELGLIAGSSLWGGGYLFADINPRGYWAVERHDLIAEEDRLERELEEERYQRDRKADRRIMMWSSIAGAVLGAVITLAATLIAHG